LYAQFPHIHLIIYSQCLNLQLSHADGIILLANLHPEHILLNLLLAKISTLVLLVLLKDIQFSYFLEVFSFTIIILRHTLDNHLLGFVLLVGT
jgi:hypothetical protein